MMDLCYLLRPLFDGLLYFIRVAVVTAGYIKIEPVYWQFFSACQIIVCWCILRLFVIVPVITSKLPTFHSCFSIITEIVRITLCCQQVPQVSQEWPSIM